MGDFKYLDSADKWISSGSKMVGAGFNFKQSSIVIKKSGKLSENLKAPTTLQFSIFCWNLAYVFYLPLSKKGCVGFFNFI